MKNLLMVFGLIVSFASVSFGQSKEQMREEMDMYRWDASAKICTVEGLIAELTNTIIECEELLALVGPSVINNSGFSPEDIAEMLAEDARMRAKLAEARQLKADAVSYRNQAVDNLGLGDVYRTTFDLEEENFVNPGNTAISYYMIANTKADLALMAANLADLLCQQVIVYAIMMQTTLRIWWA